MPGVDFGPALDFPFPGAEGLIHEGLVDVVVAVGPCLGSGEKREGEREEKDAVWMDQIFAPRSRSAFPMTETELKLIAAAAMIGLSRRPTKGYRMPAAIGTPRLL